ncbi:MAG: LamG-like jellyroll fold domain-containing protein [Candidatus Spyradenecus sp.]
MRTITRFVAAILAAIGLSAPLVAADPAASWVNFGGDIDKNKKKDNAMSKFFKSMFLLLTAGLFTATGWAETIAVNQETIGINFTTSGKLMSADANSTEEWGYYSQEKSQGGLLAENKWQNFTSLTQNESYTIQTVGNPGLSIQLEKLGGNETWGPGESTNKLLGAYLDNASTLTLRGLPTSGYDVAIIFAGDTSAACNKYSSVEVNGVPKTYNAQGELVDGSSPWGERVTTSNTGTMCLTATGTSTTGQVMYLSGMTSSTLHIKTNAQMNNTVGRGTIAAIQIYLKSGTFEKPSVELPAPAWIWNCTGGINSGETVYGTTLYTVSNKVIDTTTEGLRIPANNFTFSYWSKMTNGANWQNYAGFSDTNGGLMIQKSATNRINIYNSGCVAAINPACEFTLSSTTPQLLTFVSKNGTLKVYVDGVYVSETTPTSWPSFAEANPMKYFGLGIAPSTSGGSAGNGYIPAYVGDARVYREALSAAQVKTLYFSYLSNYHSAAYPILSMDDDVDDDGMISKTELTAETAVGNADQFCISGTVTVNKGAGDPLNWSSLTLHAANASSDSLTIAGENTLTANTTVIGVDTTVEAGAATLGAVTVARGITLTVKDNMNAINSITNNGALRLTAESAQVFDLTTRNALKNGSGKLLLDGVNPLVVNLGALGTGMKIEVESGEHTIKTKESGPSSPYPSSTINSPTIWVKSGATLHLQSKDLIGWRSSFTSDCVIRNSGNLIWEDNPDPGNAGTDCYSGQWVLDNNAVLTIARTNTQSFAWRGGSASTPNVTLTSGNAEITRSDSSQLMIHNTSTLYVKTGEASTDCLTISTPIGESGTGSLTKTGAGTLKLTGENTAQGTLTVSNGMLDLTSNWAGPVTLASSATLAGSGTIGRTLTFNENATIDPAHGAVTVNGTVTLPSALTIKIAESQDEAGTKVTLLNAAEAQIPEGMAVTVMVGETVGEKLYTVTHEEGAVKLTVENHPTVTATVLAGGSTLSAALNGAELAAHTILTIDFGDKGDGEAQPGTFTFDNAGTVSFAQIIVTGTNGGTITSSALTSCQTLNVQASVQLPIELVNSCENLTVAADKTLTIDVAQEATLNKPLSGNYTVKKSGAGTLTLGANVNVDDGVEILAGTLKFGDGVIPYTGSGSYPTTNAGDVKVHTDATLDVNGKGNAFLNMVTLCQGATYANSSSTELGSSTRQLRGITLEGNATVHANANFGILASSHAASTLNLGGHILTKTGSGAFWLSNTAVTAVSNGTLKVDGGKFEGLNNPTFSNVTFDSNFNTAFTLGTGAVTAPVTKKGTGALTIGGVISGGGAVTVEAGNLTLSGNNAYTGGTNIAAGATLTISHANAIGRTGAITGAGTLVCNAVRPANMTGLTTGTAASGETPASGWTGTVWLKNVTDNASIKEFANANSSLTFEGSKGHFTSFAVKTLTLTGENFGFQPNNGSSGAERDHNVMTIGALKGSGSLLAPTQNGTNGAYCYAYVIGDMSEFTGTLDTTSLDTTSLDTTSYGARTVVWCGAAEQSVNYHDYDGKIIIADAVTIANGKIWKAVNGVEVSSTGTLSGTGQIDSALTLAADATIDTRAGAPTVTGEVTASGTVTVVLPEGTVLQRVLTTATTGLESAFSAEGYTFSYRDGAYWATLEAAKSLTATVTTDRDLTALTWKRADTVGIDDPATLEQLFALPDVTATLHTTTDATVTIDCATVPALTLSGSAVLTLSAADGVTPTIASLTVTASAVTLNGPLGTVTGDGEAAKSTFAAPITVASGSTLTLNSTVPMTLTSSLTGAGKVVIGDGTSATKVSLAAEGNTIQLIDIKAQSTLAITTTVNNGIDVLPPETTVNIAENAKLNVDTVRNMLANVTGPGEMVVLKAVTYIFRSGKENRLAPGKLTLKSKSALTLQANRAENTGLSVNALVFAGGAITSTSSNEFAKPVVTVANGQVLSGEGSIAAPIVFEAGAIYDAKDSTAGSALKLTEADITWPGSGTVTIKASKPFQLIQFKSTVGLSHFTLVNTGEDTGLYLYEGAYGATSMLNVLKEIAESSLPPEISKNTGVKNAIKAAIEKWTASDILITEVTDAVAKNTAGKVMGSAQAVDCFTNLETTLELVPNVLGGYSKTATAVVTYDFGVADMTIKSLKLSGDDAAKMYVLLAAKVQNSADSNTASFATGTELTVLNGEDELIPTSVSAAVATGVANATETTGVRWLAVPLKTLFPDDAPTGTQSLTVKAKNTTTTP